MIKFKEISKFFFATYKLKSPPILEGQYPVTPILKVPKHIEVPEYVYSKNPVFGILEGNPIKQTPENLNKLREAGKLAARTAEYALSILRAGMTTDEIDKKVHEFIISNDAYPTGIGFMGFPKSLCTSVNEVVCHGIPNLRPLQEGDFLNMDITVYKNGVHGDTSVMGCIGKVDNEVLKLIDVNQQMLYECIKICKPGVKFSLIGELCQKIADENGYDMCDLFTAHGIGELLHSAPTIHHSYNNCPYIMEVGHAFTIEPIVIMHYEKNYHLWKDNFTVVPRNRSPSSQWEHTLIITEKGCDIITKREGEKTPF